MRRILRGLSYSEHCGSHPGTPVIAALVILGAVAGGIAGASIMAAVFGPLYLYGAYERGRYAD